MRKTRARKTNEKRAILTPAEDRVWCETFAAYVDEGMSDAKADRETWKEMLEQFPRLREFDGCKP